MRNASNFAPPKQKGIHTMAKKKLLCIALASLLSGRVMAQWNTDSTEYDGFQRFRLGGYGEMVMQRRNYGINRFNGTANGNSQMNRSTISIPRVVLAGDVKFNQHFWLGMEVEFEHGGTGQAYELENTENGEYEVEMEKGGEVAIEQFHLTYHLNHHFNVRAGHMIVPVGLTNAHHEPILFFGTSRPEGETSLLPSTWHETGLQVFGQFGRRWASFQYQAMVVSGLNANGFSRNNWAAKAKQGLFEGDNFSSPAYAARLEYTGIPGLRLGLSGYYCANVAGNSDKPDTYQQTAPVCIWNIDATYRNRWVEARANILQGQLTNSNMLSQKNATLSNKSPYSRTAPIAEKVVCYGAEAGFKLNALIRHKYAELTPFVRYEYYNAQEKVEKAVPDDRLKTSMWTMGINYNPLPYLVVKADYTHRTIGGGKYNNENEFAIGVAFTNWFYKK